MRYLSMATAVVGAALLVGCATVNTNVSTYYTHEFQTQNKSFAFYPLKDERQASDMQYAYFTDQIANTFIKAGMHRVPLNRANYVGVLSYSVGKARIETGYRDIYGQVGTDTNIKHKRVVDHDNAPGDNTVRYHDETQVETKPRYGVVGRQKYHYNSYPYTVRFSLYARRGNPSAALNGAPAYQTTVTARYPGYEPKKLFQAMIAGWLDVFPGRNGQAQQINMPLPR